MTLLFVGCAKDMDQDPPETPSNVLNKLVHSAPFQYINLDEEQVQGVDLSKGNIIYRANRKTTPKGPLVGHLTRFTHVDNRFYIYDFNNNAIFQIDLDGSIKGPLTREGRGPGEHKAVGTLDSNSQYIYTSDGINNRINRYTHNMIPLDPIKGINILPFSSFMDLNDKKILVKNQKSSGIAPLNPDEGLIAICSLDDVTDTLATIMPRIIPEGDQPQLYNESKFSINRQGTIVTSYLFLPWFFFYDKNYNHTRTLILEYSAFEEMDIPPMDIAKDKTDDEYGGTKPVTEYKAMDNGDLFFSIRRELFHLSPSSDGAYELIGRYRFNHSLEEDPLWISDIFPTDNKNEYIIGSWYYLFRVNLTNVNSK